MVGLRFSTRVVGDFIVMEVRGELDYGTAPTFGGWAAGLLERMGRYLVLDLSGLGFMDSSGLGALVTLWRRAEAEGGVLRLAGLSSPIARMFEWTGLERRLSIFPDVAAATADPPRGS